jgi:hypothetical protein
MSLSALNWRKLPTRTLAIGTDGSVSNILNNIYDMLTGSLYHDGSARVTGSDSAWKNIGRFITGSGTGSNTEAVYCYPPTQTVMSQSIVIAGVNVVGARTNTANIALCTDNASIAAGDFMVASIKNAGTFSSWSTGSNGFGAGSNSTGVGTFMVTGSLLTATQANKIVIYESKEAMALFINRVGSALTWGFVVGAIVDPEQTITSVDAEADNRIYGFFVSDPTSLDGIGTTFNNAAGASAAAFLEHGTGGSVGKMVSFIPQSSTTRSMSVNKLGSPPNNYVTSGGKLVRTSLTVLQGVTSSKGIFLGRLRDMTMVRPMQHNLVVRDGSNNIIGFTAGASETAANDTLFFEY